MKIKTIEVVNFKAISEDKMNFNGSSAIITAGNNKGKTSVLRGLIDRFQGEKPDIIVKTGEEKGFNIMELTDGSKIEWKFTKKSESFAFTTPDDIRMTTGVISTIGKRYFGIRFDIDKFINSSKKEQVKQVQKLLGIDMTELDNKYAELYSERTDANKELKRIIAIAKAEPSLVEIPDIEAIKKEKQDALSSNNILKNKWLSDNKNHQKKALDFNKQQDDISSLRNKYTDFITNLNAYRETDFNKYINYKKLDDDFEKLELPKPKLEIASLPEADYIDISIIDNKLEKAYQDKSNYDAYIVKETEYKSWVEEGKKARKNVEDLNVKITKLQEEKLEIIKNSKLPKDFEMTDDGLLYKGLPLDDNQISSSAKYICALKLGALNLGKIRTLHFDASFLDNISLKEIQEWAKEIDLQLLIERPDLNGGNIKYEVVEF